MTNSPPGSVFALDWSGLRKPEISFYTLWHANELLGCGALKDLGDGTGEIKSMRTHNAHIRKGVWQAFADPYHNRSEGRGLDTPFS